ncbi:hypothetical protein TCAL_15203 [Tigriopus californicus]|uniref:Alpha-carbonic anhydrase domain-containing protein n=1 Tax=Tigriopus californicus TaxID=6832 RepID=A0A553NBP6_TIGCA|nr:hypothetical protein TCAL_15203 [Tigriopus californicus]
MLSDGDTDSWCASFPICCPTSMRQSSIDIKPDQEIRFEVNQNESASIISGCPLRQNTHKLIQFHLHWGSSKDVGSEYSLDGEL